MINAGDFAYVVKMSFERKEQEVDYFMYDYYYGMQQSRKYTFVWLNIFCYLDEPMHTL